jgi:acetyl/propionyl-CoA carboxylase alpha subunit
VVTRPITKLLVANRGEIALRVMRTARAMGIATVAVYSDPDAGEPFVAVADEAVALGGATPAESYLRMDAILGAAAATGADAVHPGYGFLAENAAFAAACAEVGLTFVGPPPAVMEAMGSKLAARELMTAAGVPVVPGADLSGITDDDGLLAAAAQVGFPVLVKASAGGGGKGMRVVTGPDGLAEAVAAARREAASAFGDDTVFLERYVSAPRHVEVQIFGDSHGQVVSLFERECSIQRRHQKIIEESPSPAVDGDLRTRLCAAAVNAGQAAGYVGAGTVEFLLTPEGDFFFLEVNARLQVEHPVTEMVTGLDLVRLQLLVAEGHPLPAEVGTAALSGHAIEARLYAEDPEADFLPAPGRLRRFRVPGARGVPDMKAEEHLRVESGVGDDSVVSPNYDPMLAKVIAWAPTRDEAARRLAAALARARIHGVTTNRDLLVRVLRHPEFAAGATDTHFLERHSPTELGRPLADDEAERLHAVAAALAAQAERRAQANVLATLPSGWRNNPSQLHTTAYQGRAGRLEVGYRLGHDAQLAVNGADLSATVESAAPDEVVLRHDGVRRSFSVHLVDEVAYVDSSLGASTLREEPRFPRAEDERAPGSLVAPIPGTVVRVLVEAGEAVAAGDLLVVLEAMKMEHRVTSPAAGTVAEVRVKAGQTVDGDDVLVVVTGDEAADEAAAQDDAGGPGSPRDG